MKVLEINTVCGIKSTGRITTDIADVLTDAGHECRIAYGREIVPEKYREIAVRIGSDTDVKLHALRSRFLDDTGFGSKKVTRRFLKWVEEYDPDIIHLHNLHGYYIHLPTLFSYLRSCGKPVVWTMHDCWAVTGHCTYFSLKECEQWRDGCHRCRYKKAYPSSLLLNRAKGNWKKKQEMFCSLPHLNIVTPSRWLAGIMGDSYLGKYPIHAIPSGIDLDAFVPTESNFREKNALCDKKIVLGVATAWRDSKGWGVFIERSKRLPDDYKVVLVGASEEQAKELPKSILAVPRTNCLQELCEIYATADVFLNPSRQETQGLTTVEAMACGTPVAVSNLTAVPEMVTADGGIVLENLELDTIMAGIETVLNGSWNPRKNAMQYDKKVQFQKYLELYESVLK